MPTDERKKSNRKKALYLALVLLLLLIIGVLVALLLRRDGTGTTKKNRDPNAAVGQYEGKTEEEIQAELDKIVEEGMFNISIASVVTVENGDDAMVRIENIAANHHNMTVAITLDDETDPIYQSAGLAPGQYIEQATLARKLPAGEYTATALFTAYDLDTLAQAGQAAAKITLIVRS